MANIEVASICNLSCSFCFAKKHLEDSRAKPADSSYITLDDFEKRLDFLDKSMIEQVRLIGGEPTLHPKFPELIHMARSRNKQIVIFSHGLIPKRALHSILDMTSEECVVLINTNASGSTDGPTNREVDQRSKIIMLLGSRAMLGYTIYSKNFEAGHLLTVVRDTGCRKLIRFGLAHPVLNENNRYLHPKEYEFVGRKIVEFAKTAALAVCRRGV